MSAEPLLLLPGLLCDAGLWRNQCANLADVAECTVVDLTQDDDMGAMAERALAQAPPTFALAGLSMGGYVALELLRRAPGRVTRLCLIASAAGADGEAQRRRRRALMTLVRSGRHRFVGISPRLLPELLHPDNLGDAVLAGEMIAMAQRVGREGFLRQQAAILGRPDLRGELAGVGVPTAILVGEADRVTPVALSEAMAAAIPGATLEVLAGCGHLPPLERPELVSAAMREWLKRAPLRMRDVGQ